MSSWPTGPEPARRKAGNSLGPRQHLPIPLSLHLIGGAEKTSPRPSDSVPSTPASARPALWRAHLRWLPLPPPRGAQRREGSDKSPAVGLWKGSRLREHRKGRARDTFPEQGTLSSEEVDVRLERRTSRVPGRGHINIREKAEH